MKERMEMNAIMKVLIVDDEAYVRDGIEKNLPWAQLGLLAVALLLLYVPFCAARKLRNAALTAALDEGEGHAAG